jgi:beta-lactamase superfamily II metal-dependent hydrolase
MSLVTCTAGQTRNSTTLDIYVVDVEGGQATLFVTPSGESVLVDAGNGGNAAARDVGRIMAAVRDAGIQQIDHFILTHFHGDHFGGLPELARQIPIKEFIDHGPSAESSPELDVFMKTYTDLHGKAKHTVVKPGDRIPVNGLDWRIVASHGQVIRTPLPGAGAPNPFCANFKPVDPRAEDNMSVGSYITFGNFRTNIFGDMQLNRQFDLMCPMNRVGGVDLYLVPRHGNVNMQLLVHPLRPRAAIINNGTRKGGQPEGMKVLFSSPGLEDIWQIHFSELSGQEYAVPGLFIANTVDEPQAAVPLAPFAEPAQGRQASPPPRHNGTAHYFKVMAQRDGTFTIINTRNGFSKTYERNR